MKCLLDTDAVIALLKGDSSLRMKVTENPPRDYGLSAIVTHELYYGAHKSTRVNENLQKLDGLRFEILDFDAEDAHEAGVIRAELERVGGKIGILDTLIAGQAKAKGLAVLTRNTDEFKRVSDLVIQTW